MVRQLELCFRMNNMYLILFYFSKVPWCIGCDAWFNYPNLNHRYQVCDVYYYYSILESYSIQ